MARSVSKRVRFEVFKRDGFACQYCGRTPPVVTLEADHILAVANGGDNSQSNLLTSCFDCNRGKAAVPLSSVPSSLAADIERRKEQAKQLREYNRFLMSQRNEREETVRELGWYWHDKFMPGNGRWVFAGARKASIQTFLRYMPTAEIMEAMDIAHAKFAASESYDEKTFKYFCGVCWRKIKEAE